MLGEIYFTNFGNVLKVAHLFFPKIDGLIIFEVLLHNELMEPIFFINLTCYFSVVYISTQFSLHIS